jgi:hypothetical protein
VYVGSTRLDFICDLVLHPTSSSRSSPMHPVELICRAQEHRRIAPPQVHKSPPQFLHVLHTSPSSHPEPIHQPPDSRRLAAKYPQPQNSEPRTQNPERTTFDSHFIDCTRTRENAKRHCYSRTWIRHDSDMDATQLETPSALIVHSLVLTDALVKDTTCYASYTTMYAHIIARNTICAVSYQ